MLGLTVLSATLGVALAAPQTKPAPTKVTSLSAADRAGSAFFEQNIRPLFAAKCNACHSGPKASAGLRLDNANGWKGAISTGKLLMAVNHEPGAAAMPPSGGKLSPKELNLLADWAKRGAPGPSGKVAMSAKNHWAFLRLPIAKGAVNIDSAVETALKSKGLSRNPQADKRTLIRRITLDITGLPPTPTDINAFLADSKPGAFARVVDRLLASAHYGEKWARHWLDVARYAESHGYEQDYDRPNAWTYRDAVIRAFNADMPWKQFAAWQLAGDELAPANADANFLTGFLGAGTHATQITKSQVEKERYDELDDMLSVTTQAFLGLTVGCARCHDHKFDPISQRDYYKMLATFTKTVRSDQELAIDPVGDQQRLDIWSAQHKPLTDAVTAWETSNLSSRFAAWKAKGKSIDKPTWVQPATQKLVSAGGATTTLLPDGSHRISGTNPASETLTFTLNTNLTKLGSVRIEALTDDGLVLRGPGRAGNGNFALSNIHIRVETPAGGFGGLKITGAKADFEQVGLPVNAAFDNDSVSGWAVDPQFGKDHTAVFTFEQPASIPPGFPITVRLEFNTNTGHGMGRPRISLSDQVNAPLTGTAVPETDAGLMAWFKTTDPEWAALQAKVDAHLAEKPKPALQTGMICSEGVTAIRNHTQGGDYLDQTHFLRRGDPNNKAEVVQQGFLTVLARAETSTWKAEPAIGGRSSGQRSAFAKWMLDTERGGGDLVARVAVNRVWQRLFGRGIVSTPSDFGTTGDAPSNEKLLNALAAEFKQDGWSVKRLIRRLVLTQTYQQTSQTDAKKQKLDPDNRLLSRFAARPIEAENLRDQILAVSGELDRTPFGPGTLDLAMKRRSIYFFIKRSRLIPFLLAFDGTNALQSIGARQTTTVAPQALVLMNNPQVIEWCAAFAKSATIDGNNAKTVENIFVRALGRVPTKAEQLDASRYLQGGGTIAGLCQIVISLNEFAYIQ
jgi:cytochrome c5